MSELIDNLKESLKYATESHNDMEKGQVAYSCRDIYINLLISTIKMHECIEAEKRYILCVAIKQTDGQVFHLPRPARHGHLFAIMSPDKMKRVKATQGFLTDEGRFVDRVEGRKIAIEADQLIPREGGLEDLYSEDVW